MCDVSLVLCIWHGHNLGMQFILLCAGHQHPSRQRSPHKLAMMHCDARVVIIHAECALNETEGGSVVWVERHACTLLIH
jgi:hypothetical protein